jgi:hypothetical protein
VSQSAGSVGQDFDALFHRDRVTISGDLQIPIEGLAADTGEAGDFSDRQIALVVPVLCSPNCCRAELSFAATFPTTGTAGGGRRVSKISVRLWCSWRLDYATRFP